MKFRQLISLLVSVFLVLSLLPVTTMSNFEDDLIEVEAAPEDVSIGTKGPTKEINYIDSSIEGKADFISLFTTEFAPEVLVKRLWVAVQVNSRNEVVRVVSPSINGGVPVWEEEQMLSIPDGGYVLLAQDDSWASKDFRKFLATNFKVGDVIKLRKNGEVIPVTALMKGDGLQAGVILANELMYTVTEQTTQLVGSIRNFEEGEQYRLEVNGEEISISEDGSFRYDYSLSKGTNYIDVAIFKNGNEHDVQSLIVYYKEETMEEKEVFLWVEQGPNARRFQTSESIYNMLVEAKDAGVTAIALDVKGVEGFASYKKSDLTNRPYVSEMTAESRAGSNPDLDLLAEFIKHSHSLGLTVHAAMNVFAEGSIAHNEFGVLNEHLDWEEQIYRHEDGGEIKRLRDSHYGKNGALVAFVNPANPEVRDYQLKSFEEVIKNYDVDGVLLDRGRYDNYFADFSDISRQQFEQFLAERGKQLNNWPQDIFTYEGNTRVDGPLINEWYTYRSSVIKSFTEEVRDLVDEYNVRENRDVQLSAYVGSWYESYYLNGVNWASPNFVYNERLEFPQDSIYTDEYYETGYTDNLDFLMIGTYQRTANEVKKYITLGNIMTNGEIPLYAGMALVNVQDPPVQREVFQAGLQNTNGLMLFDYSQANFPVIKASINDVEYVKDYYLGISDPRNSEAVIEGDFFNVNRNDNNLNIYSEAFGPSTGTNIWGVEAVVDATGKVVKMVNQQQAKNWSWVNVQDNNSIIPEGGFVISALDGSGIRTKRQLVANAYHVGDEVRAAILNGLLNYDGKEVTSKQLDFNGKVQIVGPGNAEVWINGEKAVLASNGDFTATISLEDGANEVEIIVLVDGWKTHHKSVTVTRVNVAEVIETAKELVEQYVVHPKGIQTALVQHLSRAQKHFEQSERFYAEGKVRQAEKANDNAIKALEQFVKMLEQHAGKHINEEHVEEILQLFEGYFS
ncbi:family 10 glycosylhydrolase [Sutcliffiella cohnii]|uniref:family 10 glycosylhydrolase n=1 Tax=Sutcliffiella cohnii TaxID=33932 RepID=UPI002E222AEF|nr:family 10 glycosylhydrolase [Sutcliffiella cohnii]